MLMKALCTPDVICCGHDTTAVAAARLMRQKHIGDLVVVEDPNGDQVPLGIVTDRDIVVEVLGNGLDPTTTTVGSILRKPVIIAQDGEDISEALERMRVHGVRRLPVVGSSGKLVGVITLDDLLRQLSADANALVDIVAREQSREHRTRR